MRIYQTLKKVISVTGNADKFLNGLTTNSLDQPRNAFVNIHGRIIATFDQVKVDEEKFILVIEPAFVPRVLEHIDRYARLNKTIIQEEALAVYFDLEQEYIPQDEQWVIAQKQGQLVVTSTSLPVTVTDQQFMQFRLQHQISVLGIDYKDELLLNVSQTEFVSFTKGCFLGQEPLAKVHHRSKPSWILTVKAEEDCSPQQQQKMTSKMLDPISGKVAGFIFVANQ
jgi:folate-binding protein YgfZ